MATSKRRSDPPDRVFLALAKSTRQTLEVIVLAFILAFVFRAFIAEAYRIPTGSMAPTLYGAHQTRMCTDCGYEYAYEIRDRRPQDQAVFVPGSPSGIECPNCRWQGDDPLPMQTDSRWLWDSGDRVFVMKLGYELCDLFSGLTQWMGPKRWDVVVFKNPADASANFIKRLIGLPGETIEVIDGDVYANGHIARKTEIAQRSLWFIVHDTDYMSTRKYYGQRTRELPGWDPLDEHSDKLWDTSHRAAIYHGANSDQVASIVYRGLINDFYSYDDAHHQGRTVTVSDLKVQFLLTIREGTGMIELALSKRDDLFLARLDTDGSTRLLHTTLTDGRPDPTQLTVLASAERRPLPHRTPVPVAFENVDHRVRLYINGQTVLSTTDQQYPADPDQIRKLRPEPVHGPPHVRISARGLDCQLWHIRLYRDVYYRQVFHDATNELGEPNPFHGVGHGLAGNPITLGPRDYYVLGDNSPESKDSRLWWEVGDHLKARFEAGQYQCGTVPADQMVGKAIFVYWPAWLRTSGTGPAIVPNVGEMRFVR